MLGSNVLKSITRFAFRPGIKTNYELSLGTPSEQNSYRTFAEELAGLSPEERERRIRTRQQYEQFAQRQRLIDAEDQALNARR